MPTLNSIRKKSNIFATRLSCAAAVILLLGHLTGASAQAVSSNSDVSSSVQPPVLLASNESQPSLDSKDAMDSKDASSSLAGNAQNGPYARPSIARDDFDFHKYTFAAGGGFNMPAGDTAKYQTAGWNFQIAGGRNLNKLIGAQIEYDYNHSGIPTYIVNNLNPGGGGDVHLWSFSLDPYVNIPTHGSMGAYVIGGVGFYRKLTEFTQSYCGYDYYGFYYCSNTPVAHWSNNAFGANAGLGLTWRISRWNSAKFYSEARYVWVDNQASANNTSTNGYPPANYRTGYFPVTFGIRW